LLCATPFSIRRHPTFWARPHHPKDLAREIRAAGLLLDAVLAVEGPGWLVLDFEAR